MTILAWASVDGGPWNGDASADPATGVGGVDLTAIEPNALFPMIHISAIATTTFNFGNAAFAYAVPAGFTAGWPGSGTGGWTALDPTKISHSGSPAPTLANNNRTFISTGFGSNGCQVPDADGKTSGKYYFEAHYDSKGLLNDFHCTGVGRQYPGISMENWANSTSPGGYTGMTPSTRNGGIALGSSYPFFAPNPYHDYFGALTTLLASSPPTTWFEWNVGSTVRWAISLGVTPPVGNEITGIGDLWFGPTDTFIDLRAQSNRRLFVGVDGSTPFLGDNGEVPFGASPPIFLTRDTGQPADIFANNFGTGGSFTIGTPDLQVYAGSIPPCGRYTISAPAPNTPQGSDPLVRLSVSDDGGRTFSLLQKWRSMGKVGEYRKRLRWLKMGMFRNRQIRLEITDPVRRNIVGIYMDVTPGLDM